MSQSSSPRLRGENLTLAYDQRVVSRGLEVAVPDRSFTVIVGPNACGKSTLLRALSRMIRPAAGSVYLDGKLIHSYPSKEVARRLGLLPQTSVAPDGITVADLVARGRYPHQRFLRQWSRTDERVVAEAMAATRVDDLADRLVDELSGGQRQRVWLAMVLAQQTPLLLLDEPTTFLDLRYQVEILDLVRDLADEHNVAVGVVLHDLNQAAQVADEVVLLHRGRVRAFGPPADVLTSEHLTETYGIRIDVTTDHTTGQLTAVPVGKHTHRVVRT